MNDESSWNDRQNDDIRIAIDEKNDENGNEIKISTTSGELLFAGKREDFISIMREVKRNGITNGNEVKAIVESASI